VSAVPSPTGESVFSSRGVRAKLPSVPDRRYAALRPCGSATVDGLFAVIVTRRPGKVSSSAGAELSQAYGHPALARLVSPDW
jgi:hypothetical protein